MTGGVSSYNRDARPGWRSLFVTVHRWFGLFIAVFLFVAGLTGAVISWDHELDEWLNPHLFEVSSRGEPIAPLELAARVKAADPRRRVTNVPLFHEENHAAVFGVAGRIDPATNRQYEIGHSQVFVDPITGAILGQRDWGKAALDREHLLPFLYALHYSLHIPELRGIDRWGVWFMGIVAIVWMFDCFVGFYLTLPSRRRRNANAALRSEGSCATDDDMAAAVTERRSWWQRWKQAWQVKRSASSYRLNFDLHRAAGLWFWMLLFLVSFTAISMNLQAEVVRPLLQAVSSVTLSPFESREPRTRHDPIEPKLGYAAAIARGQQEAAARGWTEPAGYAFYTPDFGVYGFGFHPRGADPHGSGGLGVKSIYIDGQDGRILGDRVPLKGTASDVFLQLQFPLHSGRIAGTPGRIAISITGLAVALLSVTGIIVWMRKRYRRLSARLRRPVHASA